MSTRKRQNRGKTPAATQEAIFAFYCTCLSYKQTAAKFAMPYRTAMDIVERVGADDLAKIRAAMRADMAEEAFAAARALLPIVKAKELGGGAVSRGAEASRAFADIVRSAALLEPRVVDAEAPPPNITVNVGCAPPPEVEQPPQDSTITPTGGGNLS